MCYRIRRLPKLARVTVYKVGHHGSLNATPKTLWSGFERAGARGKPRRLVTLLSTKAGVHGSTERSTEVPRRPVLRALTEQSTLVNTEAFAPGELSRAVSMDL